MHQFEKTNEEKTLAALLRIEKRLAESQPAFEDLPVNLQKAVFMRLVEKASYEELIEIERTSPFFIERRQAAEREKQRVMLERSKAAGNTDFNQAIEKVNNQLRGEIK